MSRKLRDSVVIITGASSGIGRATALAFARRGAWVVIAARRESALNEVATECQRSGGRAVPVTADVSDEAAVKNIARQAIENFGRIDVWFNNAGVTLFGRFEETPPDAFRRVIETNLFGYIYGARAALPYFREQGGGVLINNASYVATAGQPYTSAYVLTKFAIRGLAECLRMELRGAKNIHVCTILPASIDTSIFQQAANYTGRAVKPMWPVYPAEQVAEAIVACVENPEREVMVGNAGRMLNVLHAVAPALHDAALARRVERDHFQDSPAPSTAGNLFEPIMQETGISGGWRARQVSERGSVGLALAAAGSAFLAWLWWRNRAAA